MSRLWFRLEDRLTKVDIRVQLTALAGAAAIAVASLAFAGVVWWPQWAGGAAQVVAEARQDAPPTKTPHPTQSVGPAASQNDPELPETISDDRRAPAPTASTTPNIGPSGLPVSPGLPSSSPSPSAILNGSPSPTGEPTTETPAPTQAPEPGDDDGEEQPPADDEPAPNPIDSLLDPVLP